MAEIGFIGVGKMGGPMAANLIKAGHRLKVFDLEAKACEALIAKGATRAGSVRELAAGAEAIVSMLPAGRDVREVYMGDRGRGGVIAGAASGTLLMDCSTIDVETARAVIDAATLAGHDMVDAPVSGGVAGAEAATLTFMVGGSEQAFARARPLLEAMGKAVIHAGAAGSGQAAKICNNLILGVSMIAVSEAFSLAKRLGLSPEKLFEVSSRSSGQCWSLTSYCPVPGLVPSSPANRDYRAGFTAAMMLKDLTLGQEAARASGAATPLGAKATALYERYCEVGNEGLDFSGIIQMIDKGAPRP